MTNEQFLGQLQVLQTEIMLNVEGLTEYQSCILNLLIANKIKKLDISWHRKTNEENISWIKERIKKLKEPKVTVESTANGMGEYFHKLWMDSLSPKHVDFYKFCENLAKEEQMKKEEKQKEETFDFYEAMRRMESGKMVETESYLYKLDKNGCVYQSIKGILDSWSIYPCHLSKHYLDKMYSEYKAKPKTFGWDEAYRLMKEGMLDTFLIDII